MIRIAIVFTIALALTACGASEAPLQDVDKAAALFFERVKTADYDWGNRQNPKLFPFAISD